MSSRRETMSPVDTAWLRMESQTNLMMIGVVLILESPIQIEELKNLIEARLLRYDRFRQKVEEKDGTAYWVEDPYFDIDHHVHLIGIPGEGTKEDLQKLASDLDSTPLDFSKPLWQVHVIDRYQGGCAVIYRIHHSIADGIALVRVMLSLTDPENPEPKKEPEPAPSSQSLLDRVIDPATKFIQQGYHFGQEVLEESWDLITHPEHLLEAAKTGATVAAELARIAALPADPPTCFKNPLGGRKQVAWAEPLPLPEVRTVAKQLKGTINDILLTASTGALRHYMVQHSDTDLAKDIHVAVPFNLRPLDKPVTKLGNEFGLVIVALPVGEKNPILRFEKVKQAMESLKKSHQAQVFYGLLGVLGKGPSVLEQTALEVLSKKASLVMTNVPGPKEALYLVGSKIKQPMFWVPQSGEIGVGLSILSYNSEVQFGVVADRKLVGNPDELVDYFITSYNELKSLAVASKP